MKEFYLKEIRLKNYRKFESKTFNLNKQMNVFIGKNSSGKTSVLEAANVILGSYLAAFKKYVPSRFVFNISKEDPLLKKQVNSDYDILASAGIPQYPCSISCNMQWDKKNITFRRMVEKTEGRTKFDGNNPMQKDVTYWEETMQKANNEDRDIVLPLVLYLSSARLWNENKVSDFPQVPLRTDAYQKCLDKKHGTQLVFDYIKKLENIAREERRKSPFPVYDVIMEAIDGSMKEELEVGERIAFSSRYDGMALVKRNGTIIQFDSLSDGYRNVIKIILDIAARMCMLNPYLKENALIETPGVVIIDELDLSLHPKWQKRIVRILKETFPKVQFICATHSPFIIQSLEPGELISLEEKIDDEYSGQSIEDIAEDIMGVPTPKYSEKKQKMYEAAEKYFKALEEGRTQEDLEKLKIQMDNLAAEYSDNPAYLALMKQKYLEKAVKLETQDETCR